METPKKATSLKSLQTSQSNDSTFLEEKDAIERFEKRFRRI
jgi:hypothetical protein